MFLSSQKYSLLAAFILLASPSISSAPGLRRSAKVAPMPTPASDSFSILNPAYAPQKTAHRKAASSTASKHSTSSSLDSMSIASSHSRSNSQESVSDSEKKTSPTAKTPEAATPSRARRVEVMRKSDTLRKQRVESYLSNFQNHWNNPDKRYRISLKALDENLHNLVTPCYKKNVSEKAKKFLFPKIMQHLKAQIDDVEDYASHNQDPAEQANCAALLSILYRLTAHLVFSVRFFGWDLCTGRYENFLAVWNSQAFSALSKEEAEKKINAKATDMSLNFEGGEFSFAKRSLYTIKETDTRSLGK